MGTTVYLRINGALVTDRIEHAEGDIFLPQGRLWDDVPAVGDLVQECNINREIPRGDEPRYLVTRRSWSIRDDTSNRPCGVILDLVQLSDDQEE